MNIVWIFYARRKDVGFTNKMRLFDVVSRYLVSYACQVLEANIYTEVERMKKWFISESRAGLHVAFRDWNCAFVYLFTEMPDGI